MAIRLIYTLLKTNVWNSEQGFYAKVGLARINSLTDRINWANDRQYGDINSKENMELLPKDFHRKRVVFGNNETPEISDKIIKSNKRIDPWFQSHLNYHYLVFSTEDEQLSFEIEKMVHQYLSDHAEFANTVAQFVKNKNEYFAASECFKLKDSKTIERAFQYVKDEMINNPNVVFI